MSLTEEQLEKLRQVLGIVQPQATTAAPAPLAQPVPGAGQTLQRTGTGLSWVTVGGPLFGHVDTRAAEPPPKHDCSFCGLTSQTVKNAKTGWDVCGREDCGKAAKAQMERMYAGLVDCEETRRDALKWVEAQ